MNDLIDRFGSWLHVTAVLVLCLMLVPTRGAAQQLDRWQEEMDIFAENDEQQNFGPGGVVFVGSSSIRMWDLSKSFPEQNYLNRGFGGSVIKDSTQHFDLLIGKHKPRLVVFYAGDNDVAAGNSAETVYNDFVEFVQKFKTELPEAQLLYISIKPSLARWEMAETMKAANERIAAKCEADEQLTFVNVWPGMVGENGEPRPEIFLADGLHMNEQGYEIWTDLLKPLLKQTQE